MEWYLILVVVLAAPLLLLPVAFVWYLNTSGLYQVIRDARKRRSAREKTSRVVAKERVR